MKTVRLHPSFTPILSNEAQNATKAVANKKITIRFLTTNCLKFRIRLFISNANIRWVIAISPDFSQYSE